MVAQKVILTVFSKFFFKTLYVKLVPLEESQYPTLGPVYFHFYLKGDPYRYLGQLLITIDSEATYGKVNQNLSPSPMPPLNEDNYWSTTTFTLNFVLLEMNGMPIRAEKIKMHLSCGGMSLALY